MFKHFGFTGLLLLIGFQAGCQSFSKNDVDSGSSDMWGNLTKKKSDAEFGEPEKLAVIWSDTTMVGGDGKATRGFGGRVYFNDQKNKPARVEGEFIVYAYDDSASPTKTTADRVYKFPPDGLQEHFSPSGIGPSYSFWIPWDPVGGERKSIALVPVFKSNSGKIVSGDQSLNVLSGKATAQDALSQRIPYYVAGSSPAVIAPDQMPMVQTAASFGEGVQQVAHYIPTSASADETTRTTTIELPRSMSTRLNGQDPADFMGEASVQNSDGSTANVSYGPASFSGRPTGPNGVSPRTGSPRSGTSVFAAPSQRAAYGKPGTHR